MAKKKKALIVVVVSDDMGLDYYEIVEALHLSTLITKIETILTKVVKDYCGQDIGEDDITDLLDGEPFCPSAEGFIQVKFL